MQKANSSQKVILTYSFFVALCSLLLLRGMFQSPSEVGNSIIFGLSLSRLIVAIGFLLVIISFAALFWKAFKDQGWAERFLEQWFGGGRFSKGSAWIASIGFGLGWIGCFLPAYRTGMLGPNWNRIQPIMSFILTASIATLAVFLIRRSGFSIQSLKTSAVFRLGLILFLVSLPVLVLMLTSEYDAHRLEDFWYGAGVPILASQLVVTVLGGILFLLFRKESNFKRFDVVVF